MRWSSPAVSDRHRVFLVCSTWLVWRCVGGGSEMACLLPVIDSLLQDNKPPPWFQLFWGPDGHDNLYQWIEVFEQQVPQDNKEEDTRVRALIRTGLDSAITASQVDRFAQKMGQYRASAGILVTDAGLTPSGAKQAQSAAQAGGKVTCARRGWRSSCRVRMGADVASAKSGASGLVSQCSRRRTTPRGFEPLSWFHRWTVKVCVSRSRRRPHHRNRFPAPALPRPRFALWRHRRRPARCTASARRASRPADRGVACTADRSGT